MKSFWRIDTVSGVILEEADSATFYQSGSLELWLDEKMTSYPPFGVIRHKQITEEEYNSLREQAEAELEEVDDEEEMDYHEHIRRQGGIV